MICSLLLWRLPSTVPCSMVFGSISYKHTWPNYNSLRCLTVDNKIRIEIRVHRKEWRLTDDDGSANDCDNVMGSERIFGKSEVDRFVAGQRNQSIDNLRRTKQETQLMLWNAIKSRVLKCYYTLYIASRKQCHGRLSCWKVEKWPNRTDLGLATSSFSSTDTPGRTSSAHCSDNGKWQFREILRQKNKKCFFGKA